MVRGRDYEPFKLSELFQLCPTYVNFAISLSYTLMLSCQSGFIRSGVIAKIIGGSLTRSDGIPIAEDL